MNAEEVKALQHLAATDPLTGLANRRGGEKHIANEISRAKRERRPLSCILLDIDRFKQVNDTFGHQAGDQLLRDISNLLRRTVRAYDILVRWGGEEFLLVLPGVDLDVARVLAERVRAAVEALDTHGIGPVTISAGVARFENDYDFAATLKTADRRLYQAKATRPKLRRLAKYALTSETSTSTDTAWPIRSTDSTSRARCASFRIRRPTTPFSGPWTTSTIVPS